MRRIAVINQKGGVGKTTTAANLGAALARRGSRVLLVDLDPQAHLSLHFGVELTDGEPSVYDVLTAGMPIAEVVRSVRDNVLLVPADIDLAGSEPELVSVTGREVLLREALEAFGVEHDYMLIDCPPSLGVLTVNALAAVDEVLIPLQAHFLALQGLGRLLETVTLVRQRINARLTVSGIVLCLHDASTRLANEVVDDLSRFLDAARGTGVPWSDACMYESRIRRNIKLAESSSFGETVFDYAPRSNGAADYTSLAAELAGETPVLRVVNATPEKKRLSTIERDVTTLSAGEPPPDINTTDEQADPDAPRDVPSPVGAECGSERREDQVGSAVSVSSVQPVVGITPDSPDTIGPPLGARESAIASDP